ncbi:methylated-DNA--protein-cysteine methyltransferase [Litchfieldella qijiaojingensis]|uniref:Methylated-DNA--protein-cysteine methyltransferase n=1 Tax=Litchfieldella qijiaojingensis TaxID=980347 RepID=A0ABQ2YQ11_9GAMM|nr:methylated-DNA--[protein]-cysteine S-methyltransferase [Halomonas qijiaojingensis]GGX88685.1 methylated-DNA--protein-cysteine methyltransferase [Halomonas qijiaojingensis]
MSHDTTSAPYLDYYQPPGETPLGLLRIRASEEGLTEVTFVETRDEPPRPHPHTQRCCEQLAEYFEGQRQDFDLPLAPQGTPFQQNVWAQLTKIPFGETCSYAEIAERIGQLTAMRAVGAANGRNPLAIVVPCHRVIGRNGQLTGYAGGLERKRWLLLHEQEHLPYSLNS